MQIFYSLDFSQVEYRILNGLAGQQDKLEALHNKRDLYCEFGTKLFGRTITKKDELERQFAKKNVLGNGYGMGKAKARGTARSEGFGDLPEAIIDRGVDLYRTEHPMVTALWKRCDQILPRLAEGGKCHLQGTPVVFEGHCLVLPNGLRCKFDLIWCEETQSWFRKTSRGNGEEARQDDALHTLFEKGYTSYWGGGLTEFMCQSLARVRLSELMIKARRKLGVRPALLVHDDYTSIALDGEAQRIGAAMAEMAAEPSSWWPDGPPFAAEVCYGERYPKG